MTIAAYIVVAIALSITDMLLFRRCAEHSPVRLTSGIIIAFSVALLQTLLYLAGMAMGDILRLESTSDANLYSQPNAYITLGLFIIVIIKLLVPYMRREPQLPLFNLNNTKAIIAMAIATGINMLIIGIGMGFASPMAGHFHISAWPLLGLTFLFGYFGIMLGRQKVTIRPIRWIIVACILLLGTAIATIANN